MWMFALAALQFPTLDDFPRAIQEAALASTVRLENPAQRVSGTGAVVAIEGPFLYILTAQHVVDGAKYIDVAIFTNDSYPKPKEVLPRGVVVAESRGVKDLALIKVPAGTHIPPVLKLSPSPDLKKKGFAAFTVGCASGREPTCEVVQVSGAKAVKRPGQDDTGYTWELEKEQQRGRSGGPLVDRRGFLVGVASGNNRDHGYCVHGREIDAFLARSPFADLFKK